MRRASGFCLTIPRMSLWPRQLCALSLGGLVACVSSRARAEPPPSLRIALEYRTDPALSDCPSQSELSTAISQQLGYDAFTTAATGPPVAPPHRVRASISRTPAGTAAQIAWVDERGESEGERRLASESGDCTEVARALTFAIAVQIQLHAAAEPVLPAPPPKTPPARPAPPPVERAIRALVGAGVLAEHGLTPATSPGLRVFGSLRARHLSVEVSTGLALPTRETLPDHTGFSASSLTGRVTPCAHFSVAGLCAVGALGQLSVRGEGVDQVKSPSSFVAGAGARVEVMWPALSALGVLVHLEALALLTRRTVFLNQEPVWSTAPIVLSAGFDLAAIFR
jgi:hypothetical protein